MSKQIITWIHLSDLHMSLNIGGPLKCAINSLIEGISDLIKQGINPDFIVFTGDVADKGQINEYNNAWGEFFAPLLRATGISRERLFIVPGNHDVNRKETQQIDVSMIEGIKTTEEIYKQQDIALNVHFAPFQNITNFLRSKIVAYNEDSNLEFTFSRKINKGNYKVLVIGLNTALWSGYRKDKSGDIDDYGSLAISTGRIREILDGSSPKPDFTIILMHHPLEWQMVVNQTALKLFLRQIGKQTLFLMGHQHYPDFCVMKSLSGVMYCMPSGAVQPDDDKLFPAYNIVKVILENGRVKGTINFYKYNKSVWKSDEPVHFNLV